jgi:hypothetical protein
VVHHRGLPDDPIVCFLKGPTDIFIRRALLGADNKILIWRLEYGCIEHEKS